MFKKAIDSQIKWAQRDIAARATSFILDDVPPLVSKLLFAKAVLSCDTPEEQHRIVTLLHIIDALPKVRRYNSILLDRGEENEWTKAGALSVRTFKYHGHWFIAYPVTKLSVINKGRRRYNFTVQGDDNLRADKAGRLSTMIDSFVVVSFRNPAGIKSLMQDVNDVLEEEKRLQVAAALKTKKPDDESINGREMKAYETDASGDWKGVITYSRDIRSVIISDEAFKKIVLDTRKWAQNRDRFLAWGIPHKRLIIIEGPPGTGKTSLIRALASELDYTLHLADLNDNTTKERFEKLLRKAGPKSIVAFDDFENIKAFQRDYVPERQGAGLRGREDETPLRLRDILNAFDGAVVANSQIYILCTNRLMTADSALLRAGRTDCRVFLGHHGDKEVRRYIHQIYPHLDIPENFVYKTISGASLQAILIDHLDDEEGFLNAVPHFDKNDPNYTPELVLTPEQQFLQAEREEAQRKEEALRRQAAIDAETRADAELNVVGPTTVESAENDIFGEDHPRGQTLGDMPQSSYGNRREAVHSAMED